MPIISVEVCGVPHQWTWDWRCWWEVVAVQMEAEGTSSGWSAYHKRLPAHHVPPSHTNLEAVFKPVSDVFVCWGETSTEEVPPGSIYPHQ